MRKNLYCRSLEAYLKIWCGCVKLRGVLVKIAIFGSTGMVGQAALLAALRNDQVKEIVAVVRRDELQKHPKLRVLVHQDLRDLSPLADELSGTAGTIYAIGVTSAGMSEKTYTEQTFDLTLAVAHQMLAFNQNPPNQTRFVYVSGAGADTSETSSVMWARVRGKTENTLMTLPFAACYVFRPGIIIPQDGIQSKTASYRLTYVFMKPLLPMLQKMMPSKITTTRRLGELLVNIATVGIGKKILESKDF